MGYIKIAYREILKYLDDYSGFSKGWDEFVKKQEKHHNLIIKSSKNKCFCTNCKHEFISTKKVNEQVRCPNCHNKYLIKRSNLRYYEFKDYLSILDKVNNTFVISYFELKTIIDAQYEHHSSIVEFAREIPIENYYSEVFVNERVSKCQCHIYISHSSYCDESKWRKYTRNYSLIDYSIVFPNNIKKLLKDTEYKYSDIWNIAKHCSYIDLSQFIINIDDIPKVEFLSKMKLYNLALKASEFTGEGSFQEIFGVSKDYYPFMKKYNITYAQLEILRLLKEKNINKIRYLENFLDYGGNISNLKTISNYISLNRFIKYSKMHHKKVKIYLYKDYLRFASLLGFDLKDNKYAFPKNLREAHDELEKQYEIQEQEIISQAIIKRGNTLKENIYKNKNLIIFPAYTLNDLINESEQQHNCVRTYAEDYATGNCDIYFLRDVKRQEESLVTVEVQDNEVVQSRIKYNKEPNEKQMEFLQKWEKNVLNKVA